MEGRRETREEAVTVAWTVCPLHGVLREVAGADEEKNEVHNFKYNCNAKYYVKYYNL